jgi:lysophospholipase L1-like esterase
LTPTRTWPNSNWIEMTEQPKTKHPRRRLSTRKKLVFMAAAVFCGLLLTEGILQLLCLVFPKVHYAISDDDVPENIDDAILGQRPNPCAPEHDDAGWRNAARLEQADIVCIGDSQTYGSSCRREEAWPQVLGETSGVATYSMAYGGYGPTHHLSLTPEALALKPKLVLYGIYSGNDIADCYRMVYYDERGKMPELKSTDPAVLAALEKWDTEARDFKQSWLDLHSIVDPPQKERSFESSLSTWFRLYGVARTIRKKMDEDNQVAKVNDPEHIEKKWQARMKFVAEAANDNTLMAYDKDGIRTMLTPQTRSDIMNMGDPRIKEGLRLAEIAMERAFKLAREEAQVAVVLIPTKEYVFVEAVRAQHGKAPPALEKLASDERLLWDTLKQFLDEQGVPWIDALPALRGCIEKGVNPYPEQWDAHPNAAGNRAMAELIAQSAPVRALKAGD